MMKKLLLLFITLCAATASFAQIDQITLYKNIFRTADSLKAAGALSKIDTSVYKTLAELDKHHPAKYFETAAELMAQSKFNEAALVYTVGVMRYHYYNSANPDFQQNNDGALLASFRYIVGDPLNMYLRSDIDHLIAIANRSMQYYRQNDYVFYSRTKDPEKYEAQILFFQELTKELQTNRFKHTEMFAMERETMEKILAEIEAEEKAQKSAGKKKKKK